VSRLRDPFVQVILVLVSLAVAGVVALVLSWRGAAATLAVWIQLPFVVSGAFAAIALIGTGIGLLSIHLDRQVAADEQAVWDDIVHDMVDVADAIRRRRGLPVP